MRLKAALPMETDAPWEKKAPARLSPQPNSCPEATGKPTPGAPIPLDSRYRGTCSVQGGLDLFQPRGILFSKDTQDLRTKPQNTNEDSTQLDNQSQCNG